MENFDDISGYKLPEQSKNELTQTWDDVSGHELTEKHLPCSNRNFSVFKNAAANFFD
jgi:hypothetical protein